ncbi:PEPxxWA-CTERM sorting domain-containing protein [Sphingomonas bacterium]|uniref:PEPxxWA-CTERM sorting domain-containing protein n=1 Tax=Sphingomonas bacterium TaxID=1895847 RepID=UPI0015763742|nr:PEPxxWA-CTERM sorting domain-containing protein [Sphingomonas bacterium]
MKPATIVRLAAAGIGLLVAAPALAQSAPPSFEACTYNGNGIAGTISPRSCASVSSSGAAPYGQYSINSAAIANGRQADDATQGLGTTASADGGWTNTAAAISNTGGSAVATGDLRDGTLHAYVSNGTNYFHGGGANTRISDLFTFNNTSGGDVTLTMGYQFDGRFSTIDDYGAYTDGQIDLHFGDPDTYYNRVLFANSRDYANGDALSQFDAISGTLTQRLDGGNGHEGDYAFTGSYRDGFVQGAFTTSLLIPTGESRFGFVMTLSLDCRGSGATCDFGHTSAFGFGALPAGLTYTSQSGVFGQALASGVPEPASWATMILGLGGIGGVLRHRRRPAAMLAA